MKTPKIIFDILSNPDGLTYSSKRIGGFISLFSTIIFGHLQYTEPMIIMAGLVGAFFGLATLDYKTYINTKPSPTDPNTGDTPVNP